MFDLTSFLKISDENGETSSLRGFLFEQYAHQLLEKGGNLKNQDESQMTIPPSKPYEFSDIKEIEEFQEKIYIIPKARNFE